MNRPPNKVMLFSVLSMLCSVPIMALATDTKEHRFEQMIQLQSQLSTLKPNVSSNAESALEYQQLQRELIALSESLGGDLPCATGTSSDHQNIRRLAPTAPVGCIPNNTNFSNATSTPIPSGPSTITSSIAVSGVDTYLWDVDLRSFITHTFPADLDMTITSPTGTVVTLSSDNGGGNDDVFNGTVWDDSANPAGQVPYTNNDGLVTDHVYAAGVLASPLVPEEALAAFVGEDPNGTWTLTISDDAGGDGGNLASWDLTLTTFTTPVITMPVQTFNQNVAVPIPSGPSVATSTVAVSGTTLPLCKVELLSDITHTFSADLDITLSSPSGTIVTLTTDNGGSNNDVFSGTLWDDMANPSGQVPYTNNDGLVTDHSYANMTTATPLVAEESLGAFLGELADGDWTLSVSDDAAGDSGQINSWELRLTPCSCNQADLSVAISDSPDPVNAGDMLTYTVTATNNGPGTADDVSINLPLPTGTSLVSADGGVGSTCNASSPVICSWAGMTNNGASRIATVLVMVDPTQTTSLSTGATASTTTTDPNPANNSAMVSTIVNPITDLSVSISDSPDPVTAGGMLAYTVTATNNGPNPADDVSISLPLPTGTTFASANGGAGGVCNAASPVVCSWAGATNNGNNRIATVMVMVDPAQSMPINSTVTANTTTVDPTPANNTAMATTAVLTDADVTISKTASGVPSPLIIGSTFSYVLDVSNTGPSSAINVVVTDPLPANLSYNSNDCGASFTGSTLSWTIGIMAPGSNLSCTLNVTVVGFGLIENTANISTDSSDPNSTNNASAAIVAGAIAVPVPALTSYGLLLMGLLSLGTGLIVMRRRSQAN